MHHSHIPNFETVDSGFAERRIFAHDDAELFRKRTTEYIDEFRKLVTRARLHDKEAAAELYTRFKFRFIPVTDHNTKTFA